jgi:hypothetical protein
MARPGGCARSATIACTQPALISAVVSSTTTTKRECRRLALAFPLLTSAVPPITDSAAQRPGAFFHKVSGRL